MKIIKHSTLHNENNIKNTIRYYNNTKSNNSDSKEFSFIERKDLATPSPSASFGTDLSATRGILPHSELCRNQIAYVKFSVRSVRNTRRTVNLDMRLKLTPHSVFNRLVFSLTHRLWEFRANMPVSMVTHPAYENAQEKYHEWCAAGDPQRCWIGKGRIRGVYRAPSEGITRTPIKPGCVMVLRQRHNQYQLWCQIEQAQLDVDLQATSNELYPFQGDLILQENSLVDTWGGWK